MATTKVSSGAGLKLAYVFATDVNLYPSGDQTGSVGYDGAEVQGIQSWTPTVPDVQPIPHRGNDRVFAQDFLPATELPTAVINTGKQNLDLDALLSGTRVWQAKESQNGVFVTNKDGQEIDTWLMTWRQALDTERTSPTFGRRRWQSTVGFCHIIPKGSPADQGAADVNNYQVIYTPTNKTIWGEVYSDGTMGATSAVWVRRTSDYPTFVERFAADGTITTFLLTRTPISVARTELWVNGTSVTVNSVSVANKTLTAAAAPGATGSVVAVYETSDSIG